MSKIENNRIYYDPYNEIRCDKFALEKFVKESEEKDKTIADLEAKLAESEEEKETLRISQSSTHKTLMQLNDELLKTQKQLAEKEKERHEEWKTGKEWKWEWQKVNQQLEQANQDKISFGVEQLEKVKASIEVRLVIIQENYTDDLYTEKEYLDMTVENENILKKIDNQIKQLKEMSDE